MKQTQALTAIDVTQVGSYYLADLIDAEVVTVTSTTVTIDAGVNPAAGGGVEVRYSDEGWGDGYSGNLIGRFTSSSFTLTRYARAQNYFLRSYDGSVPPKYSRFFSGAARRLSIDMNIQTMRERGSRNRVGGSARRRFPTEGAGQAGAIGSESRHDRRQWTAGAMKLAEDRLVELERNDLRRAVYDRIVIAVLTFAITFAISAAAAWRGRLG